MKNLLTLTNQLQMIAFNRIGLEIYGHNRKNLPSNKVLRDLRIAKKENRELDIYIEKYIKNAKKLDKSFLDDYISF